MITHAQRTKLKKLIDEYREAIVDAAFAGSATPNEALDLRATEAEARARLDRCINLVAANPAENPHDVFVPCDANGVPLGEPSIANDFKSTPVGDFTDALKTLLPGDPS